MIQECRFVHVDCLRSCNALYIMQNATCFFVHGNFRKDFVLMFTPYFGPCQWQHRGKDVRVPCVFQGRQGSATSATSVSKSASKASADEETSSTSIADTLDGNWRKYFISEMQDKIVGQLGPARGRSEQSDGVAASLQFSAHFGVFYVMGSESALESTNGKISLSDLEGAVARNKSRKFFQRREFESKISTGTEDGGGCGVEGGVGEQSNRIKMTQLKSRNSGPDMRRIQGSESREKLVSRMKRRAQKNIHSGFFPGIFNLGHFISSTSSGAGPSAASQVAPALLSGGATAFRPQLQRGFPGSPADKLPAAANDDGKESTPWQNDLTVHDRLCTVLAKCGFEHQRTSTAAEYKVTFTVSASYIVDVVLDERLDLVKIHQKPLCWVHGTVLETSHSTDRSVDSSVGESAPGNSAGAHHLRIKVESLEPVAANSDLYTVAYPPYPAAASASPTLSLDTTELTMSGRQDCGNEQRVPRAPIEIALDGTPVPAAHLPADSARRINHVRCASHRDIFTISDFGVVGAVTSGTSTQYFSGKRPQEQTAFTHLSLTTAGSSPLVEWLRGSATIVDVKVWIEKVMHVMLDVSRELRVSFSSSQ